MSRLRAASDETEELSNGQIMSCFDTTFESARRSFTDACAITGLPMSEHEIGGGGDTLCLAHAGDTDSPRKLVVLSGVHGVEGFGGSAAQIAFLHRHRHARLKPHVLLAHIVNPSGMRHFRRTNDGNIDLNRNVVDDHAVRARVSAAIRALAEPMGDSRVGRLPEPLWIVALLAHVAVHGAGKVRNVFAGGQFFDPDGLFFGGAARAPEVETLFTALSDWLSGSNPEDVVFFDLHSGVGSFGVCSLLGLGGDAARAQRIFGAPIQQGHEGAAQVYAVEGDLVRGLKAKLLIPEACAVAFECGTGPAIGTLLALRYANIVRRRHADSRGKCARAKSRMLRAFCPKSERWRTAYVRAANRFLDRAAAHLSN
jgi:hypothetical protein